VLVERANVLLWELERCGLKLGSELCVEEKRRKQEIQGLYSKGRLARLDLCLVSAEIFIEDKAKTKDGQMLTAGRPDLCAKIGGLGSYIFYFGNGL